MSETLGTCPIANYISVIQVLGSSGRVSLLDHTCADPCLQLPFGSSHWFGLQSDMRGGDVSYHGVASRVISQGAGRKHRYRKNRKTAFVALALQKPMHKCWIMQCITGQVGGGPDSDTPGSSFCILTRSPWLQA